MSIERIIRKAELLYTIGLSDATLSRMEKAGTFPKRIQLGGNSVGWVLSEVSAWQEKKKSERETLSQA